MSIKAMGKPPAWIAYVLVVFLSVAAFLHALEFAKHFPDEDQYWTLANNLVKQGEYALDGTTPSAFRPPLLPFVLTIPAKLGFTLEQARGCAVLLYTVSGILVVIFLRQLAPNSSFLSVLGVFLLLGSPVYFFCAGNLLPQILHAPLFLGIFILISWQANALWQNVIRSCAIGVLSGLSILAAASAVFPLLGAYAILGFRDLQELWRRNWLRAGSTVMAGLVTLSVISPWLWRNHTTVHPGIYVSLNSGVNLLLGNAPTTTSNSGVMVDLSEFHVDPHASEYDKNQKYLDYAIQNLKEDPGRYTTLYVQKLINGFNNSAATATHGVSLYKTMVLWTYVLVLWSSVGFCLIRLYCSQGGSVNLHDLDSQKLSCVAPALLASYLLNIAGYAVFFTRLRFRIPMDASLVLLAAPGMCIALGLIGNNVWPQKGVENAKK